MLAVQALELLLKRDVCTATATSASVLLVIAGGMYSIAVFVYIVTEPLFYLIMIELQDMMYGSRRMCPITRRSRRM